MNLEDLRFLAENAKPQSLSNLQPLGSQKPRGAPVQDNEWWNDPAHNGLVDMLQSAGRFIKAADPLSEHRAGGVSAGIYPSQNPQLAQDAFNAAGLAMTGGMPATARGAVGVFGGRPGGSPTSVPQVPNRTAAAGGAEANMKFIQDEFRKLYPNQAAGNAALQAERMRRSMGVENRPTGDPKTDALLKMIDDLLKERGQ